MFQFGRRRYPFEIQLDECDRDRISTIDFGLPRSKRREKREEKIFCGKIFSGVNYQTRMREKRRTKGDAKEKRKERGVSQGWNSLERAGQAD